MQQVCLQCNRTSLHTNLYCQESYCPAELSPIILSYGEWLGDIEVVKPLMVLRTATLYEATHNREKVLLKVAHPGPSHTARLKREADLLQKLRLSGEPHPYLPQWRPPYGQGSFVEEAVGKTTLRDQLLYFYLFDYVEAEPLRNLLTKNPQWRLNHVGWAVISLAYALGALHRQGLLHGALSPDCVLVRFDPKENVPRVLLFDLGVVSDQANFARYWYREIALPAYTAPELINLQQLQPAPTTDVYGLGLILFEMLAGQPLFNYELRSDEAVYRAIQRNQRLKLNREDALSVVNVVLQATHSQVSQRQRDAADLARHLMDERIFGPVPEEPKSRRPRLGTILRATGALLAMAVVTTLFIVVVSGIVG